MIPGIKSQIQGFLFTWGLHTFFTPEQTSIFSPGATEYRKKAKQDKNNMTKPVLQARGKHVYVKKNIKK